MQEKYTAPEFKRSAFNCPHCGAYAAQEWDSWNGGDIYSVGGTWERRLCSVECCHCKKYSYWHERVMIYPVGSSAPMPHEDMPEDCRKIYLEARAVADKSPRAAVALLRLCVQMLLPHLGGQGKNINNDIAALVKKGKIPLMVKQALDSCRVLGNHAVHPGQIELEEEPQLVSVLFGCLNLIVEKAVAEPKQVKALFESLPQKDKENIAKRDSKI